MKVYFIEKETKDEIVKDLLNVIKEDKNYLSYYFYDLIVKIEDENYLSEDDLEEVKKVNKVNCKVDLDSGLKRKKEKEDAKVPKIEIKKVVEALEEEVKHTFFVLAISYAIVVNFKVTLY